MNYLNKLWFKIRHNREKLIMIIISLLVVTISVVICLFTKGDEAILRRNDVAIENPATKAREAVVAELSKVNDASSEVDHKWLGLCMKNTATSVAAFKRIVEKDPVLARHFEGFNWANATIGKQESETMAYVTSRKGDIIGQTAKKIHLPKNDGFITDGVHTVRTYCCNDIILAPTAGAPVMTFSSGDPSETPEPATVILFGIGLVCLSIHLINRRRPL